MVKFPSAPYHGYVAICGGVYGQPPLPGEGPPRSAESESISAMRARGIRKAWSIPGTRSCESRYPANPRAP